MLKYMRTTEELAKVKGKIVLWINGEEKILEPSNDDIYIQTPKNERFKIRIRDKFLLVELESAGDIKVIPVKKKEVYIGIETYND